MKLDSRVIAKLENLRPGFNNRKKAPQIWKQRYAQSWLGLLSLRATTTICNSIWVASFTVSPPFRVSPLTCLLTYFPVFLPSSEALNKHPLCSATDVSTLSLEKPNNQVNYPLLKIPGFFSTTLQIQHCRTGDQVSWQRRQYGKGCLFFCSPNLWPRAVRSCEIIWLADIGFRRRAATLSTKWRHTHPFTSGGWFISINATSIFNHTSCYAARAVVSPRQKTVRATWRS